MAAARASPVVNPTPGPVAVPGHRRPDALVGLVAEQADLLAVVHEGHAGRGQQQAAAVRAAGRSPNSLVIARVWSWLVRNTARWPGGYSASESSRAAATRAGRRRAKSASDDRLGEPEVERQVDVVGHVAGRRASCPSRPRRRGACRAVGLAGGPGSPAARRASRAAPRARVLLEQVLDGVHPEAVDADVLEPEASRCRRARWSPRGWRKFRSAMPSQK